MQTVATQSLLDHPAELLKQLENGQSFVIAEQGVAMALLLPVPHSNSQTPRKAGFCKGEFQVPKDFDDPLPPDILDAFDGGKA